MLQQSCSRGPGESRTNTVSSHWETGPWSSKFLRFPGCWKWENTPVAKAHGCGMRDVAAEVAQGLLENTSVNALSWRCCFSHTGQQVMQEKQQHLFLLKVFLESSVQPWDWSMETMLRVHLRDLHAASTLQSSLGSGWLLHPCLWAIRAHHFNNLWLKTTLGMYVYFTLVSLQCSQWEQWPFLHSVFLPADLPVLPLKPQSFKHLQTALTFQPAAARLWPTRWIRQTKAPGKGLWPVCLLFLAYSV